MSSVTVNNIELSISAYSRFLIGLAVLFVTTHLVLNFINYEVYEVHYLVLQLFELDEENNLPTWFSSFVLLNNAVLLAALATSAKTYKLHWWVLAAGFFLLSVDEVAGLHETFNSSIDMNWAIPALVLVAIVGVSFIPFLQSLERRLMILYVISGGIFISGALGVELLAQDMDEDSWAYGIATAIEEGMEMLGSILFLIVNLNRLSETPIQVRLLP